MSRKTIRMEHATKDELIHAIKRAFIFPDYIKRIEAEITNHRQDKLLEQMREACDEMDDNRQGETYDPVKRRRWLEASAKWEKANKALSKIQGV